MNPFRRHRHSIGMTRREALQVGYSGLLGISLSALPVRGVQAAPAERVRQKTPRKPKSLILVFLTGGPSHLDMFDMKPDAPAEIRGDFKPIATRLPGLRICEHLPRLAARADKYTLVRSIAHRETRHVVSSHDVLTGHPQPATKGLASRDDWPCYSSALSYLQPRNDGIPSGINLPTFLSNGIGPWPGQHAGFLGPRYDPWQVTRDPNAPGLPRGRAAPRSDNRSGPPRPIAGRCWHTSMGSVKTWRERPRVAASRISSSRRTPSSPRARWRKPSTWSANP